MDTLCGAVSYAILCHTEHGIILEDRNIIRLEETKMKMNTAELVETLTKMKKAFDNVMQAEEFDNQKLLSAVKES